VGPIKSIGSAYDGFIKNTHTKPDKWNVKEGIANNQPMPDIVQIQGLMRSDNVYSEIYIVLATL
jgi:hypothetical protein